MDISKLISLPSAKCEIKHPLTGDKTGIIIELAGIDSLSFRNASRELIMDRISGKDEKNYDIELLAKCTLAWENVEMDGKALECNYDNAIKVYSTAYTIKEQCENFALNKRNFFLNV